RPDTRHLPPSEKERCTGSAPGHIVESNQPHRTRRIPRACGGHSSGRTTSMTLDGQTFVVTGAASGIGAATAALLRDAGAEVIGVDRNTTEGFPGTFVQADLSTAEGVAAAAGQ